MRDDTPDTSSMRTQVKLVYKGVDKLPDGACALSARMRIERWYFMTASYIAQRKAVSTKDTKYLKSDYHTCISIIYRVTASGSNVLFALKRDILWTLMTSSSDDSTER
jgi:hypothetical protein